MKYKLTLVQRILLPFVWLAWQAADKEKKIQSWHLVKKGMEIHDHNFSGEIFIHGGYRFRKCKHEGCNVVDPID